MDIIVCSNCNTAPKLEQDELGITYWYQCPKCEKCTQGIISPTSTIENPHIVEETRIRLVEEWNSKNKK